MARLDRFFRFLGIDAGPEPFQRARPGGMALAIAVVLVGALTQMGCHCYDPPQPAYYCAPACVPAATCQPAASQCQPAASSGYLQPSTTYTPPATNRPALPR